MSSIQRSLRIPAQLAREISREIEFRGERDWSKGAISLMEEALRSSRVPGIVFVQKRSERRPAVAFSGLEVWEVVATWKESDERLAREACWTPERVAKEMPFTRSPGG